MDILTKTIVYVDESFQGKQKSHFERAVFWIEQFISECSDAHKVAAYAHDIERAFRDKSKPAPASFLDPTFLKEHQESGAQIMRNFLEKENQTEGFINSVTHLISRHEEGGDTEQNAMKDADSVSFFETTAENFVINKVKTEGYKTIKEKIDWMYDRISSEQAKQAAKPHYDKWSAILELSSSS